MPRQAREDILKFPTKGINVDVPKTAQPEDTCVDCQNVRVHDSLESRERGGMRPGTSKYVNTAISAGSRIQDINYAVVIAANPPSASSLSYREIRNIAISSGAVKWFDRTTVNTATVTGSATLNATVPFMFSAELFGRIYITDGVDYKIWVGSNNTTIDWTPTAGTLPGTPGTLTPRLIDSWRGRIVLAGLPSDPHNWFMSKLGDPLDWDYSPGTVNETQAVQGGIGVVGKVGDVINALIPYSDDVMIFGCDHSIWQLLGDPQAGGRMDLLSNTVGMAFGRPYCQDTVGNIYFLSSRGGIYMMEGGGSNPKSLTESSIETLLEDVNLNTTFVRLAWDEDEHGFHAYFTPFVQGNTEHWFYDARSNGWFKDVYANTAIGPTAVRTVDGDDPDDRFVLLGGYDGFIRKIDRSAADDDGDAINAFVIIGPSMGEDGRKPIIITELQALTDTNGNIIKYEVLAGDTPDLALQEATANFDGEGVWGAGMGAVENPRKRGYYVYYKIGTTAANTQWSLERVRNRLLTVDSGRGRAREVQGDFALDGSDIGYTPPPDPTLPSLNTMFLWNAYWAESSALTLNSSVVANSVSSWGPTQTGTGKTAKNFVPGSINDNTVWIPNYANLNNRGAVQFNFDGQIFFANTISDWDAGSNNQWFCTFALWIGDPANINDEIIFDIRNESFLGQFLQLQYDNSGTFSFLRNTTGGLTDTHTTANTFATNTAYIITWGAGSDVNDNYAKNIRVNGKTELDANVNSGWPGAGPHSIRCWMEPGGGGSLATHLGSMAWYTSSGGFGGGNSGAWNTSIIQSVENTMANYYGITLP